MYDVITIGAATRDVFLQSKAIETHAAAHSPTGVEACLPLGTKVPVDDIHFTTGGGATNAAVTFARLGRLRVATIGRVGNDSGAAAILADLKRDRVAATFIQRDPKRHTAYSVILLAGSGERSRVREKGFARPNEAERAGVAQGAAPLATGGERTILVHRGASERIAAREIPWKRIAAKWFSITSLNGDLALLRSILAHAKRIGARVAWNPGNAEIARGWTAIAPLARRCTVFSINREEAAALTARDPKDLRGIITALWGTPEACAACGPSCDACEAYAATFGPFLLITDGPGGAYVRTGGTTWHIASRNVKPVNTTGAGDAFGSAFVLATMRSSGLDFALRLAMANAEGVITHMGAKAGILSKIPARAALARYHVRLFPPLKVRGVGGVMGRS